ncbi:hypothetical protein [Endozoicomonas numazuensis]|uniref:Uncharacterized protein n=1 Tax=Endozoicomonas numazuensis TaxID=1137799 RepID=A0A081N016_9GAMM|nr:hypothetical protein [Endozoicomonas numazuensis]KEQ11789.1 hypothetical protein GZ78_28480 [Endozoicomonas numazuensis]
MTDLIDQHEHLEWCAFEDDPLHCYQLSQFQLVFSGCLYELEVDGFPSSPKTPHKVDLYDRSYYMNYGGDYPGELYDGYMQFHPMTLSTVYWKHLVPYGQELAMVGSCKILITPFWINVNSLENITDLRDPDQLEKTLLYWLPKGYENDDSHWIYPTSPDDISVHHLKDRIWLEFLHGGKNGSRSYEFCTAITPEHIISVDFQPEGHWEQGKEPCPELLKKVFRSFWAFMDGLSIIESPEEQALAPGIHRLKDPEQKDEEEFVWEIEPDDDPNGW